MPTTIARKRGALKRRTVKRVVSQKQKRGGGGVRTRGRGRSMRARGRARVSRRERVAVRSRRGGVGRKRFGGSGALNLYEQKPGEEDYVYLPPDETSVNRGTDANIEWCKRNVFAYNKSGVPYLCSGKKQSPASERYIDAIIPAHKEVLIDIKKYIKLNQEALITQILSVSPDNLCPPFVYDSALFNEFLKYCTFDKKVVGESGEISINDEVLDTFVDAMANEADNIHIVIRIGNILLAKDDLSSSIVKWKPLLPTNAKSIKTRLRGYHPKSKGLFITGTHTHAFGLFDKHFKELQYNLLLGSGFCMQYTDKTKTFMHPASDKLIANINTKLRTQVKDKGVHYIKMAAAMSGESPDYVSFDTQFGDCFPTIQFVGADMLSTQGTIFHPPSHHLQVFLEARWFENEAKEHALTYFREQSQMPTLFVMMGGATQVHNHAYKIATGKMRNTNKTSAPLEAVSIACFNGLKTDEELGFHLTPSGATGFYYVPKFVDKLDAITHSGIDIIGMPDLKGEEASEYARYFRNFPINYNEEQPPADFKKKYDKLSENDLGIGRAIVQKLTEVPLLQKKVQRELSHWHYIRGNQYPTEDSLVRQLVKACHPWVTKCLGTREQCVNFPRSHNCRVAATCKISPKYEYVDLKQIDSTDRKQKQCTQLGFKCDVCGLCVAFDGGLKPELDGKYHGFCNKKCREPRTFQPDVGPCDLMGICYGFGNAMISTYASMYAYNDKYIAVHDFGNLAPVHFLIIPTTVAIPDVLSLCVNPQNSEVNGFQVVNEMKTLALNIFRKMCGLEANDTSKTVYAPNLPTLGQMYNLSPEDFEHKMDDGLPEKMLAVYNMPVSQNQLHLHIIVLPLFESQMHKTFQRNPFNNWSHWGWPRTVPLNLVERVVAGSSVEAGASGTLMGEEEARRIVGSGEGLENKGGSDWHEFCWRRLEMARDWTMEPFLAEDSARNDLLVLPLCFYHGAGEGAIMTEWLGDEYRSKMESFKASLTESLAANAKESKGEDESLQALVDANIDSKTGLIIDPDAYLRLLLKTAYMPPKPNVVSEYFTRRLMSMPV